MNARKTDQFGPIVWDDATVRGRIDAGGNYDRLVRLRRFDPLAQLQLEAMRATARHEALLLELNEFTAVHGSGINVKGRARFERRVLAAARHATSLCRELAKLGEPKPVQRIAGPDGGPIQIDLPWSAAMATVAE